MTVGTQMSALGPQERATLIFEHPQHCRQQSICDLLLPAAICAHLSSVLQRRLHFAQGLKAVGGNLFRQACHKLAPHPP